MVGGQHLISAAKAIVTKTITAGGLPSPNLTAVRVLVLKKETPMIERMKIAGSHNQQQGNCTELALHNVANLYGKVDGITDVAFVMGTTVAASGHK